MALDFNEQRVKMVDGQVRTTDVTDQALLAAMLDVPRQDFVDVGVRDLAYLDKAALVAPARDGRPARTLMEASPFAKLAQLAAVRPTDKVLDVGAGTGYSTAVFSRIAGSVTALESDPLLAKLAGQILAGDVYPNVVVVTGPLEKGHPAGAPYDVIFLNGSVEVEPRSLFDQLAEGGRLIAVIGHGNAARATYFVKDEGHVTGRRAFNAAVQPLPGFERVPAFEF